MATPPDVQRKLRQLDNDVQSIYELLARIQLTQVRHGNRFDELAETQDQHGVKLDEHTRKLDEHSRKLDEHGAKLDEHGVKLDALGVKVDRILELLDR